MSEDLQLRLDLFITVTNQGTNLKHLDPELTTHCLIYLLINANQLNPPKPLFKLFRNILACHYFQYLDDTLLFLLTTNIFIFVNSITTYSDLNNHHITKQQQTDIRTCLELTESLIGHLTTIECVKHICKALCQILHIIWLNKNFRPDTTDTQSLREL